MTASFPSTGKVRLKTNLADYPVVRALKEGRVGSDLVEFDFCGPKTANQGFKPMINEGAYDAGELAIGSFLQAKVFGRPLVLLPAVVMARFQHNFIVYNADRGELKPKDLEGRRVAVRSYTQTTGIWVRGILKHEHGVDLSRLTWVCTDDAHVAEYRDPANVERPGPGAKKLDQMLLDGDVDALIPATDLTKDHPNIRHLLPNPNEQARAWARKYGTVPDQPLLRRLQGPRRRPPRRGARDLPSASGEQAARAPSRRRHRLPSLRGGGQPQSPGADGAILRRAGGDCPRLHGRGAIRGCRGRARPDVAWVGASAHSPT